MPSTRQPKSLCAVSMTVSSPWTPLQQSMSRPHPPQPLQQRTVPRGASFMMRNSIGSGFKFIRPSEMLLVGNGVMCHLALQDLHSTTVTSYYHRVSVCAPPGRSSLHFGTVPPGRELVVSIWPSTAGRPAASLQMPSVTLLSAACSFSYSAISRLTSCVAPVHNITSR